ncbi:DUF6933 domain-containing protein [Mariniplasma anaerobium]|uniref:DUF6933 domain-containing protein n=1 Tax=Mariniplasma anaerobium TaxID=2735436 RepID=A0A7U9XVW3_9MOLU|nr:hypothetical protein [Mariniplasma anaerobium]BCR36150.1 hypothetical protein MPAN_010430 [Mariniplasma anaerobium]
MHISCTKKLLDFLKPEVIEKDTDNDLFAWHANFININRKKLLILMNDLTRFCIVFYGVKKSDFKDPIFMLQKAIIIAMGTEGYDQQTVMKYVNQIKEVTYSKTKNRTLVAQLNRAVEDSWWICEDRLYNQLFQPDIANSLNNAFVGTNHWKEVHQPVVKMKEYLEML